MDSVARIKKDLISKIQSTNDLKFLRALQTIFESSEQTIFMLNAEQEKSIEAGRNEIQNGEFTDNEQVISQMKEWLEKK